MTPADAEAAAAPDSVASVAIDPAVPEQAEHPVRRFWSDYRQSPVAVVGLVGLIVIVLVAVLAPVISPQNPYDLGEIDILDARLAPGETDINVLQSEKFSQLMGHPAGIGAGFLNQHVDMFSNALGFITG